MAYKKVEGRGIKALARTKDASAWERKGKAEKDAVDKYERAVEVNSRAYTEPSTRGTAEDNLKKAKDKVEKTFNASARKFSSGGSVRGWGCARKKGK